MSHKFSISWQQCQHKKDQKDFWQSLALVIFSVVVILLLTSVL